MTGIAGAGHHHEPPVSHPHPIEITPLSALSDGDYQRAYRYASALCGDRDLAFDLVHTAVANWLQAAPRGVNDPLGYFLRIVRNCFIADVRRAALLRWSPLEEADGVIATDIAPLEDTWVRRDQLDRIWPTLAAPEREVLFLWAVEGYTIDEISRQTGTARGTLLTRLHRMRKRFAEPGATLAVGEAT
jgi:DNA-directed RNA polymerase specialized sigma24 family protein